jgi:hypothetical protein
MVTGWSLISLPRYNETELKRDGVIYRAPLACEGTFVKELAKAKVYGVKPLHKLPTISTTLLRILGKTFCSIQSVDRSEIHESWPAFRVILNTHKRKRYQISFCILRH